MYRLDNGLFKLIETGKQQGYLTFNQVNNYLPDEAVNPEKLDNLLMSLDEIGLEIIPDERVAGRRLWKNSDPANEKADGVYPLMQQAFGLDREQLALRAAFIGDSPNDASLFAALPLSVGVANVEASLSKIATPPAWICAAECGAGFVEFAGRLIAARR